MSAAIIENYARRIEYVTISIMKCPKCSEVTEDFSATDLSGQRCARCRGIFVDEAQIERNFLSGLAEKALSNTTLFRALKGEEKLHCPQCHAFMNKKQSMNYPKILLYECCCCSGVWFDADNYVEIQLKRRIPFSEFRSESFAGIVTKWIFSYAAVLTAWMVTWNSMAMDYQLRDWWFKLGMGRFASEDAIPWAIGFGCLLLMTLICAAIVDLGASQGESGFMDVQLMSGLIAMFGGRFWVITSALLASVFSLTVFLVTIPPTEEAPSDFSFLYWLTGTFIWFLVILLGRKIIFSLWRFPRRRRS